MTFRTARWLLVATSLFHAGCSRVGDSGTPFEIELRVRSDDGEPLGGAELAHGKRRLGTTDARGLLERKVPGSEGQTLLASVTCPNGYEGPKAPLSVRLTKTRSVGVAGPRPTRIDVTCKRKTREVVLVVRAPGGTDVPVLVEGMPASVVNADGSAHVLVEVNASVRSLAVTLDTSERQDLVPKNPRRLFDLDGGDALLVMEQTFRGRLQPKKYQPRESRPRRHIPTRVD